MVNVFRLLLGLSFVLLQACYQQTSQNSDQSIRAHQQSDAATYNTQLGVAYLKQGDRPRAKRKLLAALEFAPKSADVNAAMAYYFEKTGDIKEASVFYHKALYLAPNSGAQLNNYGTFLCRMGKYKEAEGYFVRAVKDVHYINTARAYENAGLCAAAIPDYLKASIYFAKALEQDPQLKQSLYELVTIELKQNRAEKALMYLQKYPEIALNDNSLLAMAIEASHRAGDARVEAAYKLRLNKLNNFTDPTGAKNEYDSNNG